MALLLGKRVGYDMEELHGLVMAAMLKDVGHAVMNDGSLENHQHPMYGAEIISQYQRFKPVVAEAIYQPHERWDGSGYSDGLKGKDASTFACILAIAYSFYELVSDRPDREPWWSSYPERCRSPMHGCPGIYQECVLSKSHEGEHQYECPVTVTLSKAL